MLELLLFNAVPRKNTNELAHRLLAQFGTIRGVFDAKAEALEEVPGIGKSVAGYLYVIGRFYQSYAEQERGEKERECPDNYNSSDFLRFVEGTYWRRQEETLDFYLLDKEGNIFAKRRFAGGADSVELEPEAFTKMLLAELPAGLIAVHNHPTGEAEPSQADDDLTAKCQLVCGFHNVLFCDHIVYGQGKAYSYYETGRMSKISQKCALEKVLE
jgi:DNA repair protein RadC